MVRTQIQLTERQMGKVRRAAQAQGVSVAELIRRIIDRCIDAEMPDTAERYARAARLLGAFQDKDAATDVSDRHDRYLQRIFE
jgi:hypothetical protein